MFFFVGGGGAGNHRFEIGLGFRVYGVKDCYRGNLPSTDFESPCKGQ